jgi:YfiH family protein
MAGSPRHVLGSRLLDAHGFRHGFNLRTGGASTAEPYASFNLGRTSGDDPAHVEENHGRFARALGYTHGELYEVSQVHGAAALVIDRAQGPRAFRQHEADALIAPPGGLCAGVRIADCAPVLLADVESGAVAAVHAGWRGTVAGVLEASCAALLRAGSGRHTALRAAIFPHIRACCFEVGADVAALLHEAAPGASAVDDSRAKPHVDLAAILRAKLAALGVAAEHVDDVPGCTRCEPERFFSYRRGGKHSGRHLCAIVSR